MKITEKKLKKKIINTLKERRKYCILVTKHFLLKNKLCMEWSRVEKQGIQRIKEVSLKIPR